MTEIRVDPITGKNSLHNYLTGKPRIKVKRILNYIEGQHCDFCHISKQVSKRRDRKITDTDGYTRNILENNDSAYSIANRWSLLETKEIQKESSEVIIVKEHAHSLEDLTEKQASDLGDLLEKRYYAMKKYYKNVACFINCGANAGGSMAHLHGQVVGSNIETTTIPELESNISASSSTCSVCEDVFLAEKHNTLITNGKLKTYIPYSPSNNMEIRISSECLDTQNSGSSFIKKSREVLKSLHKLGSTPPYNIFLHYEKHSYAQILLRLDSGIVYPKIFKIVPITINTEDLAKSIKENFESAN